MDNNQANGDDSDNQYKKILDPIIRPYINMFSLFCDYWSAYGGFKSIIFSPYMHFSIVFTILLNSFWEKEGWWGLPISILPNLIGFTLSALALLIGWSSRGFIELLMQDDEKK